LLLCLDPVVDDAQRRDQPIGVALGVDIGLTVAIDPVVGAVEGAAAESLENRIAAGELHGETPLGRAVVGGIEIVRLPTDTNCLRISIGRPTTPLAQLVEDGAGYLRFRGALAPVRELLRDALYALERADELK